MVAPNKRLSEPTIEVFPNENERQLNDSRSDHSIDDLPEINLDIDQQFGTFNWIKDEDLTSNPGMFELHKYVREWCRVSDEDLQLWVGTNKRLSFGPIDHWTQRRSVTADLILMANGLKPVRGEPNKFTVNQINQNDLSIDGNEVEIQFTNRNGFSGQFPISNDCKIIATSKGSQLFILTLPYVETEEVIGIRPNDGFVLIHSNLSVFNTPKPVSESQSNCDTSDNNNSELKPYYNYSESGQLFILGEGGHLLLIDKRKSNTFEMECILLVGMGGLDFYSLNDSKSFPRSTGGSSGSSARPKPRNTSKDSINSSKALLDSSISSSSSESTNTGRQVNSFESVQRFAETKSKRQMLPFEGQTKKQKCSFGPYIECLIKDN